MTKENYTTLSNEDFLERIFNLNISKKHLTSRYVGRHFPEILDELMSRTSFLNESDDTITLSSRIYCIEHNITSHPRCNNPECSNLVHWDRAKGHFSHHCSVRCSMLDPKCKEQRESTCVKKYGVKNPSQSKEVQEKKNHTCLMNHGVEHPLQSKKIFNQMRRRFKEKHGVETPMHLQEAKDKIRRWWIENYGGIGFQSKIIMERVKKHYLETLGVENPSQSEIIKRKKEDTCLKNHGVKNPFFIKNTITRSIPEDEVFQFVKSCVNESYEVIPNDRTQMTPNGRNNWKANHELDIWIPKLKMAVEFQGTFWHDPLRFPCISYNDKEKEIQCGEKGIILVQVNELDWKQNREQVKEKLRKLIDEKQASARV